MLKLKKIDYIKAVPCCDPAKAQERRGRRGAGLAVLAGEKRRSTDAGPGSHAYSSAPFPSATAFTMKKRLLR